MIDEQHAAAVLYGGGAPSATAKGTPTPRTDAPAMSDGVAATALYGEPKPDPAAEAVAEAEETHKNLRDVEEAEAAERARLESTYGSAMRTARSELADRAGFDLEVARADAEAAGRLFDQHGVTSDDAQHLTEIAVSATVNGVSEEQLTTWRAQAHDVLRAEFGETARTALEDAKALVASDPKLKSYLHTTGLGDHPQVVRVVANRARQLRLAGRLK